MKAENQKFSAFIINYCRNHSQPSDFPRLTPIHRRHQLATNMATSTKNPADDTKKEKGIAL